MPSFEPTLEAAHARLAAVDAQAYARTRNALDGAVTRLSPYITHGLLSLREVYDTVTLRHPLDPKHKLVFELGWRAYWRHVWGHLGDGIEQSLHAGLLPGSAYQTDMPTDVLQACTGIPAIDLAVRGLYETGYVHNHARMWLASYLVHLRKVHWHTGAQWMLGHLLDGDVASNHLSWQWVAGTGSSKPYLFNADNVAKYAPAMWHSPGTVIDTSYEALDAIARSPRSVDSPWLHTQTAAATSTPALLPQPPQGSWASPDALLVRGRDVWLLHPWAVRPAPQAEREGVVLLGIGLPEAHSARPWSARRWDFVTRALQLSTQHLWWAGASALAPALASARSVTWQADPHIDALLAGLRGVTSHATDGPALFTPVAGYCKSFSRWWAQTRVAP
jgi:deoxyribodipyrimidine photo-lyase